MRPEVSRCFLKSYGQHNFMFMNLCLYIFQSSWADDSQDWHTAAHYRSGGSNPPCAPRADQWHVPLSGLSHCHQGCGATVQVHTGMWATCALTHACLTCMHTYPGSIHTQTHQLWLVFPLICTCIIACVGVHIWKYRWGKKIKREQLQTCPQDVGAGTVQWLECWACDRKVTCLSLGGIIFFSWVNLLCWLIMISVPPPCQCSSM